MLFCLTHGESLYHRVAGTEDGNELLDARGVSFRITANKWASESTKILLINYKSGELSIN